MQFVKVNILQSAFKQHFLFIEQLFRKYWAFHRILQTVIISINFTPFSHYQIEDIENRFDCQ